MFFGCLSVAGFFFVCSVRSCVAKNEFWFNTGSFAGFVGMMLSLGN